MTAEIAADYTHAQTYIYIYIHSGGFRHLRHLVLIIAMSFVIVF